MPCPTVLGVCAELYKDEGARLELVALNPATSDETCTFLAARPFPRLVEILAQNQVRLLRCPPLVEALGENPLTGMATIDRILHFLGVERGEMEEPEPESRAEPLPVPPPPDPETAPAEPVDGEVEIPADMIEEAPEDLPEEQKQERSQNLQARVGNMTIIEKVKLARLGNVDARSLLVRDRNKLVAAAAIRNPKITDSEIEGFARARNLCDEVMRIIAHNRQWTRAYPVKLAELSGWRVRSGDADFDKRAETFWNDWSDRCDIRGNLHLGWFLRLAESHIAMDGDCGVQLVEGGYLLGIEGDRIRNENNRTDSDGHVGGIDLTPGGRPIRYHVWKRGQSKGTMKYDKAIPAENFVHLWRPERLDGVRGVSWFMASANDIRDLQEIMEAVKGKVKLENMLSVAVKSDAAGQGLSCLWGTPTEYTVADSDGNDESRYKVKLGQGVHSFRVAACCNGVQL